MTPVVVASKNPDKIAELEAVLAGFDPPITVVRDLEWPDVEETEPTLEGNAVLKAAAVVRATGHAAIADDTGLEVDALGGGPGVQTARYAGPGRQLHGQCCPAARGVGRRRPSVHAVPYGHCLGRSRRHGGRGGGCPRRKHREAASWRRGLRLRPGIRGPWPDAGRDPDRGEEPDQPSGASAPGAGGEPPGEVRVAPFGNRRTPAHMWSGVLQRTA